MNDQFLVKLAGKSLRQKWKKKKELTWVLYIKKIIMEFKAYD